MGSEDNTTDNQKPKTPADADNKELVEKVTARVWKLLERDLRTENERSSRRRK